MTAVAVYRPLVVWAANPWDLVAPHELLALGLPILAVQVAAYLALSNLSLAPSASVVAVSGVTLAIVSWHSLPISPWLLLGGVVIGSIMLQLPAGKLSQFSPNHHGHVRCHVHRRTGGRSRNCRVREAEPYPIIESQSAPETATETATGRVEDVLVVVVDSYPSLLLADDWYGHDTTSVISQLRGNGFDVIESGWSHNTFTPA
jgi:hypothetical protein